MGKSKNSQKEKGKSKQAMKKLKEDSEDKMEQFEIYYESNSESNHCMDNADADQQCADNIGDPMQEQSHNQMSQQTVQTSNQITREHTLQHLHESAQFSLPKPENELSNHHHAATPLKKKITKKYDKKIQGKQQGGIKQDDEKAEDDDHHNGDIFQDVEDVIMLQFFLNIVAQDKEELLFSKEVYPEMINRMQSYLNDTFSQKFFADVAQLATGQIFESKFTISAEDIKKFTAFLLFTSQSKMESIDDYFSNSFLQVSNIIPKELFLFISSTLSAANQNLHGLSNTLSNYFNIPFDSNTSSSSQKQFEHPQLIKANYLDFFNEYKFDFLNNSIKYEPPLQKPNKHTLQLISHNNIQYSPINQEQDNFLKIEETGEVKVSVKQSLDAIFASDPIFNHNLSSLKPSSNSVPNILYQYQTKKQNGKASADQKEENNLQKGETKRYAFCYNPTTLQLVSIQQVESNLESCNNTKSQSKHKKTKKLSTQEAFCIDSKNPNPDNFQNILFKDKKEDPFSTLLLKPLLNIKLLQFENIGLRSFAEIVHSMCINIFQQLMLRDYHNWKHFFLKYSGLIELLYKQLLDDLTKKLTTHQQQKIQVEIVIQRHSLQKKKHCNFCLVCKHNLEKKDPEDIKSEDAMKTEESEKKKKSKYECSQCSAFYEKSIHLCVEKCDEEFHKNPSKYIEGRCKKRKNKKKIETIVESMENVSVGKVIEQLDSVQKVKEILISKIQADRLVGIEDIYNGKVDKYSIRKPQTKAEIEYMNNELQLNDIIEKIAISIPACQQHKQQNNNDGESTITGDKDESNNIHSQNETDEMVSEPIIKKSKKSKTIRKQKEKPSHKLDFVTKIEYQNPQDNSIEEN